MASYKKSNPITSKTMWTIYIGQAQLWYLGYHVILTMGPAVPTQFLLTLALLDFLLAGIGVLGISLVDRAVILGLGLAHGQTDRDQDREVTTRSEGSNGQE